MDRNGKLMATGVGGALVSAVCCLTPVLVILLGAVGLSACVAELDYVLVPAFAASVALAAFAFIRRKRSCPAGTSP